MKRELHELKLIKELSEFKDDLVEHHELGVVNVGQKTFPITGFTIGTKKKDVPVLGLFGGVHGLEKVGTHVVVTYLTSLFKQLTWDKQLRLAFEEFRIVSIPLINPGGMSTNNRANPNGVDLMRNSPTECEKDLQTPLVSGHRISPKIPWYRGKEGAPMEIESQILIDFVKKHMFQSKSAISVDFHSGFGMKDRLWYPYAFTKKEFPRINEVEKLKNIMDQTHPHHVYHIEPQWASYTINGDLWDHLFLEHFKEEKTNKNIFIPLTLEMGSWIWVKKNPLQLFSASGLFNPIKAHRHNRTMRRHIVLIKFLFKAVRNHQSWS